MSRHNMATWKAARENDGDTVHLDPPPPPPPPRERCERFLWTGVGHWFLHWQWRMGGVLNCYSIIALMT